MIPDDPVITEIRRIRHAISAEHGHDPSQLLESYAAIQEEFKDQLVNYGQNKNASLPIAPGAANSITPVPTVNQH